MKDIALEVKNLRVEFNIRGKTVKAVNDLSWQLKKGHTLGIVGESGCGKSVSSLAILRLIPDHSWQNYLWFYSLSWKRYYENV